MTLLIQNARIASEHSPVLICGDVLVENGIIKTIAVGMAPPDGARVIDARNRIVMPGMFDAHVHFREPGFEAKETIASGSAAAINGGVTGVVMMPNTSPAIDSATVVASVLESARPVQPLRNDWRKTCQIPRHTASPAAAAPGRQWCRHHPLAS